MHCFEPTIGHLWPNLLADGIAIYCRSLNLEDGTYSKPVLNGV